MLKMTAQEIAELVGGKLVGAADLALTGMLPLEDAGESDLAFVAKKDMCKAAAESRAGAIVTAWQIDGYGGVQILCDDPELAASKVLRKHHEAMFPQPVGLSKRAFISPKAKLGERVAVGHFAVIEDDAEIGDDVVIYPLAYVGRGVKIGPRTVIHPNAMLYDRVEVGAGCCVHANVVIGDEGFRFIQRDGLSIMLPHIAGVKLGDNVDIRAVSTIARGMLLDTVVGNDVKIGKHCHVAHNCRIGDRTVLAGSDTFGGSVTIGEGVMIGGAAAVSDHINIGDGAVIGAGSGLMSNVGPGETYWGMPARPLKLQMRIEALLNKLPEMRRKLLELEKTVADLAARLDLSG